MKTTIETLLKITIVLYLQYLAALRQRRHIYQQLQIIGTEVLIEKPVQDLI